MITILKEKTFVRHNEETLRSKEWWEKHRFNHWVIIDGKLPDVINGWSTQKILAKCDCGNEKLVLVNSLFFNKSKSCGDCQRKTKEYWLTKTFSKLRLLDKDLPPTLSIGSHNKVWVICTCGKETSVIFKSLVSGNTTSCGKCNAKSRDWWLETKFGDLQVIDSNLSEFVDPTSTKKIQVLCKCGNIRFIQAGFLPAGYATTCGHCNDKPKEWWLSQSFGELIVIDNNILPVLSGNSKQKILVRCSCGKEKKVQAVHLFNRAIVSCKRCGEKSKEYWLSKKYGKLTLIDKDLPKYFVPYCNKKFLFKCDCGTEKYINFGSVIGEQSQSCGCQMAVPGGKSKVSRELYEEVKKLFSDTVFSSRDILKGKEIDIYIPSEKLAIEYNGLPWHSERFNGEKRNLMDYKKYQALKELRIRYIGIFSDEWNHNSELFLNLILNACGATKNSKRIYTFEIKEVSQKEFQEVHDKFHYLSGRKVYATKYLLAFYKDIPIGGWSFKKINETTLDWTRAFWDHEYKAWNPHSKVLKYVIEKFSEITNIITFSDNRLFDGSMYEKLGFEKVRDVPPDYEYTDNFKRLHKFNFRVKAGIDERKEAGKRGFYRVYDCGKIKWRLIIDQIEAYINEQKV